jgi:uridine kinase
VIESQYIVINLCMFVKEKGLLMSLNELSTDPTKFSEILYEKMKQINPGVSEMELYEFRYGLNNLEPHQGGWAYVQLEDCATIEQRVNDIDFYRSIQIKPLSDNRIILDPTIVTLTNILFAGLVSGCYTIEWVNAHFYFDIRGFYFLHRTHYFTEQVVSHHGGQPYRKFEPKQKTFETHQDIGYQAFKASNAEVDQAFIQCAKKLVAASGTPVVLAIAGQTAAGKTEIVERLHTAFRESGQATTSIEMDNFLTDRDQREEKGIHTQGKEALHLKLLQNCLEQIRLGNPISTPRYDFVFATSSHDLNGNLKPDGVPVEIEPADIIFIEGNFPFLIEEVSHLIDIKVVYLTDDSVRLKRKWKRDIDYRKKYEPTYFRNRFFKDQFIMAKIAYIPQMAICDLVVDTTGAALWATLEIQEVLAR